MLGDFCLVTYLPTITYSNNKSSYLVLCELQHSFEYKQTTTATGVHNNDKLHYVSLFN